MKSKNLLLAIGLAAIDGLLCAFLAILALAFFWPSEAGRPPQDDDLSGFVLLVRKAPVGEPGAPVRTRLALTLEARGPDGEPTASGYALPDSQMSNGDNRVIWSEGRQAGLVGNWRDCITSTGVCQSRLVMTGVRPDSELVITMRAADTVDQLTDDYPEKVQLDVSILPLHGGLMETRVSGRLKLAADSVLMLAVRLDKDGKLLVPGGR